MVGRVGVFGDEISRFVLNFLNIIRTPQVSKSLQALIEHLAHIIGFLAGHPVKYVGLLRWTVHRRGFTLIAVSKKGHLLVHLLTR